MQVEPFHGFFIFINMRYQYNPDEPANSWEVSYIISVCKPHIELGFTKQELYEKVGSNRAYRLRQWSLENFDHQWFLRHI